MRPAPPLHASLVRAVLAFAAVVLLGGCNGPATTPTPDAQAPSSGVTSGAPSVEGTTSLGALARPGLYQLGGERVQALGTLEYRDVEGGFWAVVDRLPGTSVPDAAVIAVLVDVENVGVDLKTLEGRYVAAEGERRDGASIRMSGPEIELQRIDEVVETQVIVPDEGSGDDSPTP